jgi:hypothetical protein
MLMRGVTLATTSDQRPVPCLVHVTLHSAQRRPLRQTGFWVRRSLSPQRGPAWDHTSSASVELS